MLTFIHRMACVLALLALVAGRNAWADDIRIGFMPYLPYTNVLYAKQKGLIEEELKQAGIDKGVTWRQFSAGGLVSEGMAAKELDLGILGVVPATIGRSAGQDSRIVALGSTAPRSHALVVRADLAIADVAGLKGKRVATTYGSTVYELLYRILDEAGMTVKDVELVNMQPADMNVSLRNKSIDAAVIWDPLLPRLRADGVVRELRNGTGINDNINVIVARGPYVEQQPEAVRAVLRGIARANEAIKADPGAAGALFAATFDLPDTVARDAVGNYAFSLRMPQAVQAQMKQSAAFLKDERIIRRPVDVDAFLDLALID
ncbi:aliphatic sulfonate ABC transporter substrate-binding protein [Bordetella bronchiseptica]|uniref:aliphatic sulfonate ABC transporter substrate-binding protein n=1 Tax=Bordetella bronchiseptica TaxID=518 RepID=UPI00046138DB|nr:aliphatic sulfonate ABC transporter substrate-binding protein [Bordetella bronchiseptica]KDC62351.1 ABC transporter, substrate-binding protein, aliphatic sulfonates family [Bordetella bronchiseptica MBORD591]